MACNGQGEPKLFLTCVMAHVRRPGQAATTQSILPNSRKPRAQVATRMVRRGKPQLIVQTCPVCTCDCRGRPQPRACIFTVASELASALSAHGASMRNLARQFRGQHWAACKVRLGQGGCHPLDQTSQSTPRLGQGGGKATCPSSPPSPHLCMPLPP